MFGTNHRLDAIEQTLKNEIYQRDRRIESLERQIQDLKTWGQKWRQKAKFLRQVRRELTEKLTFHEKPVA